MLIDMKQRKNESLQEFIIRFNTATLEMTDLDQMVAMLAMKGALKPFKFLFSLEKKFSTSFSEMLSRAEKDKRKRDEPPNNDNSAQVRGSPKSSTPRFHNYTSLNAPRSNILIEIQDQLPPA